MSLRQRLMLITSYSGFIAIMIATKIIKTNSIILIILRTFIRSPCASGALPSTITVVVDIKCTWDDTYNVISDFSSNSKCSLGSEKIIVKKEYKKIIDNIQATVNNKNEQQFLCVRPHVRFPITRFVEILTAPTSHFCLHLFNFCDTIIPTGGV